MAEGEVVNLHTCKSYPQKGFCFFSIKKIPWKGKSVSQWGDGGEGNKKK